MLSDRRSTFLFLAHAILYNVANAANGAIMDPKLPIINPGVVKLFVTKK